MFSTLDGTDNRHLIVRLLQRRGEDTQIIPVELSGRGSLHQLATRARAMPTPEIVQALADEIAAQPWHLSESAGADGAKQARLRQENGPSSTRPVAFDVVEVRVWKLDFEHGDTRISAAPRLIGDARAERRTSSVAREVDR